MKQLSKGSQWILLLIAFCGPLPLPLAAQSPNDNSFVATLGELREASYSDKEGIVERLGKSGHPSVRAVLTRFWKIVSTSVIAIRSYLLLKPLTLIRLS